MAENIREWDGYDGYLFDIDGTLLTSSDLVHYDAFNSALSAASGREMTIDGVIMQGNVDGGIMRDAFSLHEVPECVWRPRRASIIEAMGRAVTLRRAELRFVVHPHVRETLTHLKDRGAVLGTATGNLASVGTIKLQEAGLFELFNFYGWSDAFEWRADVVLAAAERARSMIGARCSLCVVGDTPADTQAARACGLDVISVATGTFTIDQLRAEKPDFLVATLADLHAVGAGN